jgi:translation initiation factor 6 (eIF-6)
MTPETGQCLVNLAASVERIAAIVGKLAHGQKADINDMAELKIARDTIAAVKDTAMAPGAFQQEGALTQEEIER